MSATGCGCSRCRAGLPCDCCVGTQVLTPVEACNRPGLDAISYRVGSYGQFFETMKARLSMMSIDVATVQSDGSTVNTDDRPLTGLTTRDPSDFSIALLDGWSVVGDVLSFFQERIANEGYLRCATERRSILELARLVGYALRPGVAATVYLAYTLDDKQTDPVTIPIGARSQSVPGPGEKPQSFETAEVLDARAAWNTFAPRMTRPQIQDDVLQDKAVYLKGTSTQLAINDPLLIDLGDNKAPLPVQITSIDVDKANDRTRVSFVPWPGSDASAFATQAAAMKVSAGAAAKGGGNNDPAVGLMQRLTLPPSLPPRNTLNLTRALSAAFANRADLGTQVVENVLPVLRGTLGPALSAVPASADGTLRVYAPRVKAAPFGNNAPWKTTVADSTVTASEWGHDNMIDTAAELTAPVPSAGEVPNVIFLDAAYDKLQTDTWMLIDTNAVDWAQETMIQQAITGVTVIIAAAGTVQSGVGRSAYGMSGKSTRISLLNEYGNSTNWFKDNPTGSSTTDLSFQLIRRTEVHVQSEELALAAMPIADDLCHGGPNTWIELDGYYSELKSGRWAIVSGERADITADTPLSPAGAVAVAGVQASELVMLSNVIQDIAAPDGTPMSRVVDSTVQALPSETPHTFIQFAKDLGFCYTRDKVTIYGNVVKATHGETRNEVLGSGDGSKELQSFTLKQPPLTFVSAPTAAGAESTLRAYVNDVEWHETASLAWLGAKDRGFATLTDDAGNTSLTFGNGEYGARLPTGLLNVRAVYRNGIGNVGNVRVEQISQLQTRPLGVKAVINPLRASGGADKESRDLARENAPLSVMPLDRLVSVQDYADFTRRFAGIGKAIAQRTSDDRRQIVFLSIAGVDDVPIDKTSDLYRNLIDSLLTLGDPDLPLRVEMREFKMLVLSAKIKLAPDYVWDSVVAAVRARLLDVFGFGKRALGQWVLLSEVVSAIQNMNGVAYVDVDALGAIPEMIDLTDNDGTPYRRPRTPNEVLQAVQDITGPGVGLRILRRGAADTLPQDVDAWPGGSDAGVLKAAELVVFSPAIPDTLILNQIP